MQDSALKRIEIPFNEPPLPDEVLGSWLSRLFDLNGMGVWKEAMDTAGFSEGAVLKIFDLPKRTDRYLRLLEVLGLSVEQLDKHLTTAPFWEAFGFQPTARGDRGRSENSDRRSLSSDSRLPSHQGTRSIEGLRSRAARFCKTCVEEDLKSYGIAYWHRSHQLPTSLVCVKHRSFLSVQCPGCKVPIFSAGREIIRHLGSVCWRCSTKLSEIDDALPSAHATLLDLAAYGEDALNGNWRSQSAFHMRTLMMEILARKDTSYSSCLKSHYGMESTPTGLKLPLPGAFTTFSLIDRPNRCGPLEFCAVFAALGIPFAELASLENKISGPSPTGLVGTLVRVSKRLSKATPSLEEAKAIALDATAHQPSALIPKLRKKHKAFWKLLIDDPEWLHRLIIEHSLPKIPSIEEDRATYLQTVDAADKPRDILARDAYFRLQVRDSKWLREVARAAKLRVRGSKRADRRAQFYDELANMLLAAIRRRLESTDIPSRITFSELAMSVSTTLENVNYAYLQSASLKAAFDEAKRTYRDRRIRWIANDLLANGRLTKPVALRGDPRMPGGAGAIEHANAIYQELMGLDL